MFDSGEAGFASVDALVALVVLTLAVVLSLETLQQAARAARLAAETRDARTLLTRLVALRFAEPKISGQEAGFLWTIRLEPTIEDTPVAICRRTVVVKPEGVGRNYKASTLEACPVKDGA